VPIYQRKLSEERMMTQNRLLGLISALLLALLYWYHSGSEVLSQQDVDQYITAIDKQSKDPGGRHDMDALREFLENDDGKAFYTVNLYKFFEQAQYQDQRPLQGSGREAFERFSQVMVRLLATHASHPVFAGEWPGAGVNSNTKNWDRIVIVRYRSRRDIADIFASQDFARASADKWAALEKNERMLVQGTHIPELYALLILALLFLAGIRFYSRGTPANT